MIPILNSLVQFVALNRAKERSLSQKMPEQYVIDSSPFKPIFRLALVGFLVISVSAGCQEEAGAATVKSSSASAKETSPVQAVISKDAEAFTLKWTGPKTAQVAKTFMTQLQLKAKAPFKVNQEYPIKMKLNDGAGLVGLKKVVGTESLKLSKKTASLNVELKATKAGPVSLTGTLYFSVCTEDRCLIEKQPLGLELTATTGS
jgi:hypothetical protein